jgi:hypothetical protein
VPDGKPKCMCMMVMPKHREPGTAPLLTRLSTHCVSELNDISGASSSNPVNVLTHTMSDVSHRLTTASEALEAKYLHIKTMASEVRAFQSAALRTLLLNINCKPMHANMQQLKAAALGSAGKQCKVRHYSAALQHVYLPLGSRRRWYTWADWP